MKVRERENRVVFRKIGKKEELCVSGISDASYKQDENAVSGEVILLGNKRNLAANPVYWKSGVVRKVCLSAKAAETRSMIKVVDDTLCLSRQISQLLNTRVETRMFTDSKPLLESIGSSGQVEEKSLHQSVASLKQNLEDADVDRFSWIPGSEIVADALTKQGPPKESLEDIVVRNEFRHALTMDNLVMYEDGEIKIRNLTTKEKMRHPSTDEGDGPGCLTSP